MKTKATHMEQQKDESRIKYLAEIQAQRERDFQDARTLEADLKNACPDCQIIRSITEIQKGICDNCDFDTNKKSAMTVNGYRIETSMRPFREQYRLVSPTNQMLLERATFAQCWSFVITSLLHKNRTAMVAGGAA